MLTTLNESSIQIIETQTQRIKTMAGLVCTQCECPTDENEHDDAGLCLDCQLRLEELQAHQEDDDENYWSQSDEHRTY